MNLLEISASEIEHDAKITAAPRASTLGFLWKFSGSF
jgi:hypothetical protein